MWIATGYSRIDSHLVSLVTISFGAIGPGLPQLGLKVPHITDIQVVFGFLQRPTVVKSGGVTNQACKSTRVSMSMHVSEGRGEVAFFPPFLACLWGTNGASSPGLDDTDC